MARQERQEHRGDRGDRRDSKRSYTTRKPAAKFQLPKGTVIDYKDISLLQRFVSDRGKMLSRRITGISAKEQREISRAVKIGRFLGLLPVLGTR